MKKRELSEIQVETITCMLDNVYTYFIKARLYYYNIITIINSEDSDNLENVFRDIFIYLHRNFESKQLITEVLNEIWKKTLYDNDDIMTALTKKRYQDVKHNAYIIKEWRNTKDSLFNVLSDFNIVTVERYISTLLYGCI